jgi:putative nucleotidyltransferase with HDIG domain
MPHTVARPHAPWALRLLPPFPAIAQRILALASQENVLIRDLGALIKLDPTFSAELLRVANSALFGARREVATLTHAILLLGLDRVKAMATYVALNTMVRSSLKVPALRKVWVHSLVTAWIAEAAARAAGTATEAAYTAGLLHNLGTLGLMSAYPEEYARLLEVTDDYGFDLLETERDLFEIDHCAAGAYLAREWHFPEELAEAIATHHEGPEAGASTLSAILQVSWRLSDALGYAAFSPSRPWSFEELTGFLPHSRETWIGESLESAKSHIDKLLAAAPL